MLAHFMLELYGCDRALLSDEALRQLLSAYPAYLGLEGEGPVHISRLGAIDPRDDGLCGRIELPRCQISLRAWPHYGEVAVDLCSREDFSQADAVAYLVTMLHTDDIEVHLLLRGTRSGQPATPGQVRYAGMLAASRQETVQIRCGEGARATSVGPVGERSCR